MQTVLDKGFVKLEDIFGDELTVVNSARVSFGKRKGILDKGDIKLMKYLKEHKHYSPFRHLMFRFHIKAPEFVMRQLYKHVVGIESTSAEAVKDHAWNEISQRYCPVHEFYTPEVWRKQSENSKQASDGVFGNIENNQLKELYSKTMDTMMENYNLMIGMGVAKEQARIVIPLSIYTEVIWTCSFQALANFIELRTHSGSQYEIQLYAEAMRELLKEKLPVLYSVWFGETEVKEEVVFDRIDTGKLIML